jgi:hypothetical protein
MHVKRKQRQDPEYRYMPAFPETATPPKMAESGADETRSKPA